MPLEKPFFIVINPKNPDESLWFQSLHDIVDHITDYDVDLNGCAAYRINADGTWTDASRLIDEAIRESELEDEWHADHIEWLRSPEKTGRI